MTTYQETIDSVRVAVQNSQYESALSLLLTIPEPDDLRTNLEIDIEKLRCYVMLRSVDPAKVVANKILSDFTILPEKFVYMSSQKAFPAFVEVFLNFIYLLNPGNTFGDPLTFPYQKFLADFGYLDPSTVYSIYLLKWQCENDYLSVKSTGEFFEPLLSALTPTSIENLKGGHKNLLVSIANLLTSMAKSKDDSTRARVQAYVTQVEAL